MTLEMLLLNAFLLAQLVLSWERARDVAPAKVPKVALQLAGALATVLAFALPWATLGAADPIVLAVATILFLTVILAAHAMDPAYVSASLRHRLILLLTPLLMTSVSICLATTYLRELTEEWPLSFAGLAILAFLVGSYQSWRDFQNIGGMEPDDWKVVISQLENPDPGRRLSDYRIWARIFLVCLMIVILLLQVAAVRSTTTQPETWLWALLPTAAGLLLAGATHRIKRDGVNPHTIPSAVYILSCLSILLCAISVAAATSRMLAFSDLTLGAIVYRASIGVLIGAMYTEDLLASFFLLNRLPVGLGDVAHATVSGIGFAAIFACASTVSYYGEGGFRMSWILFIGTLLAVSYAASTIAWQGVGRQIPSSRLLTLKRPEEIALADNSMFIALLGGCVAGASLLSNGQDPRVAGTLGGLILAFIVFAVGNDHQHLRNENERLLAAGSYVERSPEERATSLKSLLRHLRFQEAVPVLVVVSSFLWAVALDWL